MTAAWQQTTAGSSTRASLGASSSSVDHVTAALQQQYSRKPRRIESCRSDQVTAAWQQQTTAGSSTRPTFAHSCRSDQVTAAVQQWTTAGSSTRASLGAISCT